MKNCIYFNLQINKKKSLEYYGYLYYALKTLLRHKKPSSKYDIVVFYTMPNNLDFKTYLFNNKYNLYLDFPDVTFIESDYYNKYKSSNYNKLHSDWMSKWYSLEKLYYLNYDNVLMIDLDVIFFKDPIYLFDKYINKNSSLNIITAVDSHDPVFEYLFKSDCYLSSILLFSFKGIGLPDNFYKKCIKERKSQNKKAKKANLKSFKFSKKEIKDFKFFNEQYSAQRVFEKHGYHYSVVDIFDIASHRNSSTYLHLHTNEPEPENVTFELTHDKNGAAHINNCESCIIHYSTALGPAYVPAKFLPKKIIKYIPAAIEECHVPC